MSETTARDHAALEARERAADYLVCRHYFRWTEALPWLIAIACFFLFPNRMTFGNQVLIMVMFALSLDLIMGYAGIVTLVDALNADVLLVLDTQWLAGEELLRYFNRLVEKFIANGGRVEYRNQVIN